MQLLGVELRALRPTGRPPRDGDGDGFYSPSKGAPDKTPVPAKLPTVRPRTPMVHAVTPPPERVPITEHVKGWHADTSGLRDLMDAAATGATPAHLLEHGIPGRTRAAVVDFGNGHQGVATRYLGAPDRIDAIEQADSDQLVSALARAFGIPAPRVLRIDDDRSVSDLVDGPTWTEAELDTDAQRQAIRSTAGQRLGILDLLTATDTHDPRSIVLGPDGVVSVQSEASFAIPAGPNRAPKLDKRTERLTQLAAAIDAAGPGGLSRADATARLRGIPASQRDELLSELLDTGAYALVPSKTGNLGHGAKVVRVGDATVMPWFASAAMVPPPDPTTDVAPVFWAAFVSDGAWQDNPLTEADVKWLRQRLYEVGRDFDHLGRSQWWQFAFDRLAVLALTARGTTNLFAPAGRR